MLFYRPLRLSRSPTPRSPPGGFFLSPFVLHMTAREEAGLMMMGEEAHNRREEEGRLKEGTNGSKADGYRRHDSLLSSGYPLLLVFLWSSIIPACCYGIPPIMMMMMQRSQV